MTCINIAKPVQIAFIIGTFALDPWWENVGSVTVPYLLASSLLNFVHLIHV